MVVSGISQDLREQAKEYSALGNAAWKRRAIAMDQAIQSALRDKLPIRVVVCESKMRNIASEQKASQVQRRMLDDVVWGITYYDWQTGRCRVTRAASNNLMDSSTEPMALIPEEVGKLNLQEGAKTRILVNAYERNTRARALCLEYWGPSCVVCGVNFEKKYGIDFRGLIHVHHLRPLASIGANYTLDPVKDLRPVCPNCHAAMHYRKDPPYTVEETQRFLEAARER